PSRRQTAIPPESAYGCSVEPPGGPPFSRCHTAIGAAARRAASRTAADTGVGRVGEPDTAQSDTAQSDTAQSDTAQSDTAQSDTAQPDTADPSSAAALTAAGAASISDRGSCPQSPLPDANPRAARPTSRTAPGRWSCASSRWARGLVCLWRWPCPRRHGGPGG